MTDEEVEEALIIMLCTLTQILIKVQGGTVWGASEEGVLLLTRMSDELVTRLRARKEK